MARIHRTQPDRAAINHHLGALDQVSQFYEASWGIGRLPLLVPQATREHWRRQWEKLNAAITERHLDGVAELTAGCARAYAALEQEAWPQATKSLILMPGNSNTAMGMFVYRVCRTLSHARLPPPPTTTAVTLQELINLWESRHTIYDRKVLQSAPAQSSTFDFSKGDSAEF